MAVHLTIENETSLPDGGPLTCSITGKRGIDIGRDAYLDWCLPDPTRTVSGKHCEIRYHDGGYWLHDVSRNGTFLNRNAHRLQEPHRLCDGDRIEIGRYMILVRIDGEDASADPSAGSAARPPVPGEYWNAAPDAAPPISPRDLRAPADSRPVQADFRDWAVDVPAPMPGPGYGLPPAVPPPRPAAPLGEMAWSQGAVAPPPPLPPATPVPSPRRPHAGPPGADPWGGSERLPGGEGPGWDAEPAAEWTFPAAALAPPPDPVQGAWTPPPHEPAKRSALPPAPDPAADNPWGRPSLGADLPPLPAQAGAPIPAAAPPLPAAPLPMPVPPPAPAPLPGGGEFLARFAKGAGVSPEVLGWRDPGDAAEELGALMRLAAENLKQLLSARAETKRVARAGGHTMIQALDNNPLKFSPTVDDALKIMLGRPSTGYLDARRAFEQSFKDLKVHQVKTYSAMQHALRLLMEDLDPASIEESTEGDRGIGALLGSRKAKLWDLYVARWDTLTSPHEDGMVDAFMMFFAECYDRGPGKG
jgi:type VI secretion system protein ImpI